MKKVEKIIPTIPCIIFIVWYIIVSYANVYACDDYWHGANVHSFGLWNAQSYYWYNWEGSFTHTFFATFPHVFHFDRMPFVCNILSLFLLIFAAAYFIRTFFRTSQSSSYIIAFYLVAFLLTFTSGGAEIRYWVCANNTYILGLSTTLLYLSLYHRFDFKTKREALGLFFLLVVIIGNKVSFIYFAFLCTLIHDVIYTRLTIRRFAIISLVFAILSLLNILAPGNFVRLSQNMEESAGNGIDVFETLWYRVQDIGPFVLVTAILLPICLMINSVVKGRTIIILTIGFLLAFVGDTFIMYVCFRDSGPKRGNIIIEIMAMLYTCMLMSYCMSKLRGEKVKVVLTIVTCLLFAYVGIGNVSQINQSYTYSKMARKREQMVTDAHGKKEIVIPPLPESGLLLSYFSNEEVWIENVYLPYYGKRMRVIILENDAD